LKVDFAEDHVVAKHRNGVLREKVGQKNGAIPLLQRGTAATGRVR
jgi:hypothetical protein